MHADRVCRLTADRQRLGTREDPKESRHTRTTRECRCPRGRRSSGASVYCLPATPGVRFSGSGDATWARRGRSRVGGSRVTVAYGSNRRRQQGRSASSEERTVSIVWLASYPKSGNTWLRAVLTNYLQDESAPASIKRAGRIEHRHSTRPVRRAPWGAVLRPDPGRDPASPSPVPPLFPRAATRRRDLPRAQSVRRRGFLCPPPAMDPRPLGGADEPAHRPPAGGAARPPRHAPGTVAELERPRVELAGVGAAGARGGLRADARRPGARLRRRRSLRRPRVGRAAPRAAESTTPASTASAPRRKRSGSANGSRRRRHSSGRNVRRLAACARALAGGRARRRARAGHGTLRLSARGRGVSRRRGRESGDVKARERTLRYGASRCRKEKP